MLRDSAKRLVICIILLGFSPVSAAATAYQAQCASCHGEYGTGISALNAPNLTRLSAAYMTRQITAFKEGWRAGKDGNSPANTMAAAVAMMDSTTLELAVKQAAALPTAWPAPVNDNGSIIPADNVSVNLKKGKDYYTAFCGSCHGTLATGNELLGAPSLLGLDSAYLVRQYTAFADGLRGGKSSDRYAQQMGRLAKALPNADQIDSVMAHIEILSLNSQSPAKE